MRARHLWVICVASAGISLMSASVVAAPRIKPVPIKSLSTVDGHAIYQRECAVCHGVDGDGDGIAVAALGVPVPDLTLIAARDGRYDLLHVVRHLADPPAGSAHMPDWDRLLRRAYSRNSGAAALAELNLAKYIGTLQRSTD